MGCTYCWPGNCVGGPNCEDGVPEEFNPSSHLADELDKLTKRFEKGEITREHYGYAINELLKGFRAVTGDGL